MNLHAPVALNASTFTFGVVGGATLSKLIIYTETDTVYVGPTPRAPLSVAGGVGASGQATVSYRSGLEIAPGAQAIMPGQLVTGSSVPANAYVRSYNNGLLTLSANLSGAVSGSDTLVFSDPPVNASNGIPVLAGGTYEVPAGWHVAGTWDIYCAATTTVRISYEYSKIV